MKIWNFVRFADEGIDLDNLTAQLKAQGKQVSKELRNDNGDYGNKKEAEFYGGKFIVYAVYAR
jgi:hypothetical protein